MPKFPNSTALEAADYSAADQKMTITMKGGRKYTYEKVDQATYDGLISAKSPGAHFQTSIKGKFTHTAG